MTTDVDLPTAVSQQFPSATPRASADCPAFNIPADGAVALLQYLRDAQGYDFLMDVTAIDWRDGWTGMTLTPIWPSSKCRTVTTMLPNLRLTAPALTTWSTTSVVLSSL